jgi:hypothetical protein
MAREDRRMNDSSMLLEIPRETKGQREHVLFRKAP